MRGFFYCSSQPISTQHRANFAIRKSIAQMLFNRRECACVFDLRDGFADGLGFFGSEERVGWVKGFLTHHVSKFEVLLIGGSENHRPYSLSAQIVFFFINQSDLGIAF